MSQWTNTSDDHYPFTKTTMCSTDCLCVLASLAVPVVWCVCSVCWVRVLALVCGDVTMVVTESVMIVTPWLCLSAPSVIARGRL